MSEHSSLSASPSAGFNDSNGASDFSTEGSVSGGDGSTFTTIAELAHLLANGQWGDGAQGAIADAFDANGYDGHVALALDTDALPHIDSTLDLLTSSHDLFDVPALDVSPSSDDASSA